MRLHPGDGIDRRNIVQIRFLLGPAGSGKTYRCLAEIRAELLANAEGLPLIFLAPKQATFQLERQLLEGDAAGELQGFSRLRILSFERLARFIFEEAHLPAPRLLSEQGRVMVLRAILGSLRDELTIFRNCARRLGFAQELSRQFREFQQSGLTPAKLKQIVERLGAGARAGQKLRDLALVFEKYLHWLKANQFQDADALLTLAAELVEKGECPFRVCKLWFDGFAQLTPQERRLLRAVVGRAESSTLAFCIESEERPRSALSPWMLVGTTFGKCRAELEQQFDKSFVSVSPRSHGSEAVVGIALRRAKTTAPSLQAELPFGTSVIRVEKLRRDDAANRFNHSSALRHLERAWSGQVAEAEEPVNPEGAVEVVRCVDPEGEAIHCAREIIEFVRKGGRYREAAVLLRSFENDYPHLLRRVFQRYEIPFFLDQRENVAHHPLAELTRGALRTVVFNWQHTDLFTALKSGLVHFQGEVLDSLENAALTHGWDGKHWKNGFQFRPGQKEDPTLLREMNEHRERLVEPLLRFERALGHSPTGAEMANAIREFWSALKAERTLESWSSDLTEAVHATVWEQMNSWLADIELAFHHRFELNEWLPILEAGLSGLTVGIIPPVLDHVLIGAVDRSRNPDLKLAFVLGANEGVFPAIPERETLLTEQDRDSLLKLGCELARIPALQLAQEQFYGYIACTRARERLVMTYAAAASDGSALNPSRFVSQLQRVFPTLREIEAQAPAKLSDVKHAGELLALVPCISDLAILANEAQGEQFRAWQERFSQILVPNQEEQLEPEMASRLHGKRLKMAVSSMERFAGCPFRFFVQQGLRVEEREEFRMDIRQQGSFQHEVLSEFHKAVTARGKRWRDLSVTEARNLVGEIADRIITDFEGGLFSANHQNRFVAETYKGALQDFVATVIGWFESNGFDPEQVELPFGYDDGILPGWEIPLANGNVLVLCGRIDRVDVFRKNKTAYCIIMDYKSGTVKPDRVLIEHGVQQQLPAYLLALTQMAEARALFQVKELIATGCFLVPLRPVSSTKENRTLALAGDETSDAYRHNGFFHIEHLPFLNTKFESERRSPQFQYSITNDGAPYRNRFDALEPDRFATVLANTESLLRNFGKRIYEGDIAIYPFKKGARLACDQCKFQSICRFDPWVQKYNVLRATKGEEAK